MHRIRIGTRGSRLAMAQTRWVVEQLRMRSPEVKTEVVVIRTTGDRVQDATLGPELGVSFFTKEIEDALLAGDVDLAVHSCKDLSTRLPKGLVVAAFPPREDPRDVLVSRAGGLAALPAGARVGTSSPRRRGFVAVARPDVVLRDLRGNVPTRVRMVDEGRMDAVVLAAAGLVRLGMVNRVTEHLEVEVMVPAAGQGALALETRADDDRVSALVTLLDDLPTRLAVEAERACLRRLDAGCQAPVGALASVDGDRVTLAAAVVTAAGVTRARGVRDDGDAEALGVRVGEDILARLGRASLSGVAWAGPAPSRSGTPT